MTGQHDQEIMVTTERRKAIKYGQTMARIIPKSRFKPRAPQYFREIQENGDEIIITDRGRPVLRITPYTEDPDDVLKELRHSVKRYSHPLEPVGLDDWETLP